MHKETLPCDDDWESFSEVRLQLHRELEPNQRRAIELDYGIKRGGVLTIRVRKAMDFHLKHHLKVVTDEESW